MTTWAGLPGTILGWPATSWLPYKRVATGSVDVSYAALQAHGIINVAF
jgi:hypothetical protein